MKSNPRSAVIALLLSIILPGIAIAQVESAGYQGYLIWEDVVYPSEAVAYENMTRKQMELYTDQNFPHKIDVYNTTDFTYYWVVKADNYAFIDTLYMDFNDLYRNAPDRVNEIREGFAGTHESTRSWTCYSDAELSFQPTGQEGTTEEGPYLFMGFCYPLKGMMEEAREAMKGFVRVASAKGAKLGWDTYIGDLGVDAPMFFWSSSAKDPVEFYSLNSADFDIMGEEADELWNDLRNVMRKYEEKQGWYREDLSYDPGI
jgi:hypothetical protein